MIKHSVKEVAVIEIEERRDIEPVCPHCKTPIARIYFRQLAGLLGKRYVYFCSSCQACLGVSHRKGFFMG